MKCRYNDIMEFYVVTPKNASYILDKLGFGESKCAETSSIDGRYGRILDDGIEYGFNETHISSSHARIRFGDYAVDDAYDGWSIMDKMSFYQLYEVMEKNQ